MALIDLYSCEIDELEQHISNPETSNTNLEYYIKELTRLIEKQKIDDKEEHASQLESEPSPRARRRKDNGQFDSNFDAISISSTTSSRTSRRIRSRNKSSDNTQIRKLRDRNKSSRAKMDTESEDDMNNENNNGIGGNNIEYEWMNGINNNNEYDSSSNEDPLLNLDLINLDDNDYDMLMENNKKKHSHKKKKKKHKKKDKHGHGHGHKKDKKRKKKKKKKRNKNISSDDDYLLSSSSSDYADWDSKEYELRLTNWSTNQLEKEIKSLERQIETEKNKKNQSTSNKWNESEDENLNNLTIEQIQEKFNKKLSSIKGKSKPYNKTKNKNSKHSEDQSKLYCICRKPYDGTTQMICCDYCQEWYHLLCIGLSSDKLTKHDQSKFKCPICNGANTNDLYNNNNNNNNASSFDSPKTTPNPPNISHIHGPFDINNNHKLIKQNEKYKKLIQALQKRLEQCKNNLKKQNKEMTERLNKAKKDIDQERNLRIAVEKHMKGAKEKSDSMVKELGDCFQHQKQKEAELVNKLKKLEANKKKYKDSATENKKKMRQLKEDHENRLAELENEMIPTLNDKIRKYSSTKTELESQLKTIQSQRITEQQQAQHNINTTYQSYRKCAEQLSIRTNELAKIQNLNSQLTHKMNKLHMNANTNHNKWENINKIFKDKINQLTNNNNYSIINNNIPQPPSPIKMPSTPGYLKFNDLELEELKMCRELCQKLLDANLFQIEHMAARASLTRDLFVSWVTGVGKSPTVINDLNQATMGQLPNLDPHEHLSMNCIRLLLIEIRKQLETISSDNSGQHDTETITKVKSLLLEFQTASQSYEHKMNEFKILIQQKLIEQCRQPNSILEMYCVIGTNENNEPKSDWIKVTVCNFDQNANRVLVRKSNDNSMSYAAIDSATLRLPQNDNDIIIQSTVNNTNNNTNNSNTNGNNNNNNNIPQINRSQSVNNTNTNITVQQQPTQQQYQWNNLLPRANSSPNPRAMGMGIPSVSQMNPQMNFGSIPSFPTITTTLPSFDNLTSNNNINNGHTINNISNLQQQPIIIDNNNNSNKSTRKRKRDDSKSHKSHSKKHHKKHKKHHKKDDTSSDTDSSSSSSNSDSDSDISTDSDSDSDTQSHSHKKRHKKNKKKKHKNKKKKKHKNKKHKKSKKKHSSHKKKEKLKEEIPKKRKRGRPPKNASKIIDNTDNDSVTSLRKRRGTKRQLNTINNGQQQQQQQQPNHKKRKLNMGVMGSGVSGEYDVIDGGGDNDKNDSVCRICKHPGDLVCCEGCPSAYHSDCIRPRVKQEWLDKFQDWYCPSCAPRNSYVPLKTKNTNDKWPINKEPLLKDLKEFLNKYTHLERDYKPVFHPTRKNK